MRSTWLLVLLVLAACEYQSQPNPDEAVRQAFNLMKQAPYYTQNFSATDSSTEITRYTVRYQSPDRYQVQMEGGPEVIVIGQQAWGNDPDQGWIALSQPNPDPKTLSEPIKPGELSGFRFTGKQNATGFDIYVLGQEQNLTVFVNPATGRLQELFMDEDGGSISMTVEYQTPVHIQRP